ncbi:MAG: CDGSH iron-sulfur domain-containing protein [Dysgonomonas sp.]|nr:CDGSH iron-sulfur domain-containing protein [Dysgonomonas sp.]
MEKESLLKIKVLPDGPLFVQGKFEIELANGTTETKEKAALCRCGGSHNKPYCDGTHAKIGFKG